MILFPPGYPYSLTNTTGSPLLGIPAGATVPFGPAAISYTVSFYATYEEDAFGALQAGSLVANDISGTHIAGYLAAAMLSNLSSQIAGYSTAETTVTGVTANTGGVSNQPTIRTGSAVTGTTETYIRYTGSGGHTETLPANLGLGRQILVKNAGTGDWDLAGNFDIASSPLTLLASNSYLLIDGSTAAWEIN